MTTIDFEFTIANIIRARIIFNLWTKRERSGQKDRRRIACISGSQASRLYFGIAGVSPVFWDRGRIACI
ncbi:MAG: hypothetical protein LBP59_19910, partial [Planctomycetaceae bacterium]|nr:hypothetical protein [Planctomycetaceae bacterium]